MATDNAGNTSTSTLSATDYVGGPTPIIGGITEVDNGAWTNTASDTITVSVSDLGGTVASVAIYDNNVPLNAATLTSGAWTYTTGSLADGTHKFTAVAMDTLGATSRLR